MLFRSGGQLLLYYSPKDSLKYAKDELFYSFVTLHPTLCWRNQQNEDRIASWGAERLYQRNMIRIETGIQQPVSVRHELANGEIPARASETKRGYSYAGSNRLHAPTFFSILLQDLREQMLGFTWDACGTGTGCHPPCL